MNIAYIISRYPAVSHTFIMREVMSLRGLGHEVTTITIRRSPASQLLTENDRAEAARTHVVTAFKPGRLLAAVMVPLVATPGRFFRAMGTAWKLRRPGARGALWALFYFIEAMIVHRIAQQTGAEHLHAHFANVSSDVAMIAASLGKFQVRNREGDVAKVSAATFSFTMHGPTEFFDIAEHRLAEKARAAKFVLCISDFARSQLMPLLPPEQWSKLQLLHCGVDPEQFKTPRVVRKAEDPRFGILCVARLAPVKGHAILLKVVEELALRGHDVHLTLIGDGPLRHSLEQLAETMSIQNRVSFLGSVGQDVIHRHYAEADVFVLPSFAEGVPVVLMEAMAARCPVVATRINGIPELIEDHVTGLLVPPGRPDLLADGVERILAGPRAAERMAMAAAEKIRRDFNIGILAVQLDSIFRQALKHSVRRSRVEGITAEQTSVPTNVSIGDPQVQEQAP